MLGKTIGAGSMGKVKLARKEDGSEQVRLNTFALAGYIISMNHLALRLCA
jgi:hypothetical protein